MIRSKVRNAALLGTAIVMIALAATRPTFSIVPIAIALLCLLLLATFLSEAGRLSEALLRFRNRTVEIRIWGEPLPGGADEACRIESIRAIGAGLHLFVRRGTGRIAHLKIAQPRVTRIGENIAEIGLAKYVQWEGRKLPGAASAPAVTVTVREPRRQPE